MRLVRSTFKGKSGEKTSSVRGKIEPSFLTLKSSGGVGLSSLRRSVSLAFVLALLAVVTLSGASIVHAQTVGGWTANGWVSSGTIQDLTGNSNLAANSALIAGHSYNLTLQISVPNTSPGTKTFEVSLNNAVAAATSQSVFWVVHNPSYPGYNRTAFTGGSKTVTFNYVQGTAKVSAYFTIPTNFTAPMANYSTQSGNSSIALHLPQNNVILVAVVPFLSTGTGSFTASVEDQTIQNYVTAYNQASNYVPAGKIPSAYSSLVNSILNESQVLNKLGLPDQGTNLLDDLIPSAFPLPPNGSLTTDLLVGLVAAVVVVVLLAVMMLRTRGKSGYSEGIINDVQKDLAVLEVTAVKYDKAMADKLKSIRDKLSESS